MPRHVGCGLESSNDVFRGAPDVVAPVAVVPEHGSGYPGRPGLLGFHHTGRDWSPRFSPDSFEHAGNAIAVRAVDGVAGLVLDVSFDLDWALTSSVDQITLRSKQVLITIGTVVDCFPQYEYVGQEI